MNEIAIKGPLSYITRGFLQSRTLLIGVWEFVPVISWKMKSSRKFHFNKLEVDFYIFSNLFFFEQNRKVALIESGMKTIVQ